MSPDGEQVTLDGLEQLVKETLVSRRPDQAEAGVQLVYIAIGRHAGVILRHPAAPEQTRVSFVSGASVDLHWPPPTRMLMADQCAGSRRGAKGLKLQGYRRQYLMRSNRGRT